MLLEELLPAPERPDPARAAQLVRRESEEVAAECLHVDRAVRRRLGSVDDDDRTLFVGPRRDPLNRVDRSERVRDEPHPDDLDRVVSREIVESVELKLTRIVDRDVSEGSARPAGDKLPRHEVGVVLELGNDNRIAGTEILEAPRIRNEVDRLGGAAREDDLPLRRSVDERSNRPPGSLVALGRALCQPVDATMDVRVLVLVESAHPIENLTGLLRR